MTNEEIKIKVETIATFLETEIPMDRRPMSWNYVKVVLEPMLTELVITEVRYQTESTNIADNLFLTKQGIILALWYATYRAINYDEFYEKVSERLYANCYQFARDVRDEEFPIDWNEIAPMEAKQC